MLCQIHVLFYIKKHLNNTLKNKISIKHLNKIINLGAKNCPVGRNGLTGDAKIVESVSGQDWSLSHSASHVCEWSVCVCVCVSGVCVCVCVFMHVCSCAFMGLYMCERRLACVPVCIAMSVTNVPKCSLANAASYPGPFFSSTRLTGRV